MTWLAPIFLAGFAAIALPIWLHRLSDKNPNRQRFTSFMLLEAGEPRRILAKKLQYLLLLAFRIAALVLLALAFAQPAWLRLPGSTDSNAAKLHLIVVDTSASMGYGDRWDRAVDAVDDVLASLGPGDRAELVAAGRVPAIVAKPTTDRAVIRQSLATMHPGVFRVDYGGLMRALDGMIVGTELPVVIELITDGQKSAMPVRFAELAPRRSAELRIHDIAKDTAENWTVEGVSRSATTGELAATVRSFASDASTRTLSLDLNGTRIAQQQISIEPGASKTVKFDAPDLQPGGNRITAELAPPDELPLDDRHFLALDRPMPQSVLVVSVGGDDRDSGLFVDAALKTLSTLEVRTQSVLPSALASTDLDDIGFIVVPDAGVLDDAGTKALTRYVETGGSLLMALGRRTSSRASVPVSGERIRGLRSADSGNPVMTIGTIDFSHPALQGLDALRAVKISKYVDVTPATGDQVLIHVENGSPLLLERRIGAGRVLVWASTLNRDWNDLPVQPAFVPFVGGLANELLGRAGNRQQANLGSVLSLRTMGLSAGQILNPAGERVLELGAKEGSVLVDQVGFYEAQGAGRSALVAVNVDPAESDLTPVDADWLARWQNLGSSEPPAGGAVDQAQVKATPVSLAPWLLALLVAVLCVESLLGNWHLGVHRGIAAG